jgi:hypothetical protein
MLMNVKQGSIKGKRGADSTQHMLHCMSQYNNGTLRKGRSTHGVGKNQWPELN